MGKWLNGAQRVRATLDKAATHLDDREASACVALYPQMQFNGSLIKYGTRIQWNGQIKKAVQDLWDTYENCPDAAPGLWSSINYKEGYRIIPNAITADQAFAENELGWWGDVLYKSKIKANVWTPDEYPDGWTVMLT